VIRNVENRSIDRVRAGTACGPWLFIIACALLPWLMAWLMHPEELPGVRVIYRSHGGDNEYLPFIRGISQGNFGEPSVLETQGQGVVGFPFASVAPLAICVALFGTFWGYVVADLVIGLAFFALLRAWCRRFGASRPWTAFVAAAYVCLAPSIMYAPGPLTHLDQLFTLWGPRLPRPFVTDLYFVAALIFLLWMAPSIPHRTRARHWFAAGALVGLTSNSYIFHTLTLAPVVFFLWLWTWRTDRWTWRHAAECGLAAALAATLAGLPFLLQRLYATPDYAARLGVFTVARWRFSFGWSWEPNIYFPFTLLLLGFWWWAQKRWLAPAERTPGVAFGIVAGATLSAFFGPPLMALTLGELVLPYHFALVVRALSNLTAIAFVATWGSWLTSRRGWPTYALPAALAGAFGLAIFLQMRWNRMDLPIRDDMYKYPGQDYRACFSALARELASPRYAHDRVMATLDGQVYAYWVGILGRNSFCYDTAFSPATEPMVVDRLLLFLRELKTPAARVGPLLDNSSLLAFWLGSDKYQCSPLHMMGSPDDYATKDFWWRDQSPPWHAFGRLGECWLLALPLNRQAAYQADYEKLLALPPLGAVPRLDLIVLNADRNVPLTDPDPARYELTYHDGCFRVWQRRE
jgi:hypothetical protein